MAQSVMITITISKRLLTFFAVLCGVAVALCILFSRPQSTYKLRVPTGLTGDAQVQAAQYNYLRAAQLQSQLARGPLPAFLEDNAVGIGALVTGAVAFATILASALSAQQRAWEASLSDVFLRLGVNDSPATRAGAASSILLLLRRMPTQFGIPLAQLVRRYRSFAFYQLLALLATDMNSVVLLTAARTIEQLVNDARVAKEFEQIGDWQKFVDGMFAGLSLPRELSYSLRRYQAATGADLPAVSALLTVDNVAEVQSKLTALPDSLTKFIERDSKNESKTDILWNLRVAYARDAGFQRVMSALGQALSENPSSRTAASDNAD
jgi:hypothetical protein